MRCPHILAALGLGLLASTATAADAPKRLLLVTHSGGFMHDSILVAEQVLEEIGPKHGFAVTGYRFTGDPDARVKVKKKINGKDETVEVSALQAYSDRFRQATGEKGRPGEAIKRANCGRINAETLKNFDAVLFFTTGNPVTREELKDLTQWVRDGNAFAGTHCATDTLYNSPYGDLIGAYFDGHPWHQKIRLHINDPHHPAAKGFHDGSEITDEMYQFRSPYSRERLHLILTIDDHSIDVKKGKRPDGDYAVAWCHDYGKGKVFYTSLGHRREVWRDPRYQGHLLGGLRWAVGLEKGDAAPTGKNAAEK